MKSEKETEDTQKVEQEDTSVDVEVEGSEEAAAASQPELPREKALEAEVQRVEDQRLRAVAELDNFRKRAARQLDDLVKTSNDRLLIQMLEVVDSFERALDHSQNGKENDSTAESFANGVKMIHGQMLDILRRHDVRSIEVMGEQFDPNKHEALMQVPSDEYENGSVAAELVKGYMIGDRVLRHSKVSVSTGPPSDKTDKE